MDDEPNREQRLCSPMTVGELMARLHDADPDFLILIDEGSQSLLIVNPRPGFCCPTEKEEHILSSSEQDEEFLRSLHIK